MIDTTTPRSPGWWARVLAVQLQHRRYSLQWSRHLYNPDGVRPPLELLNDYLRGEPPLTGEIGKGWNRSSREFLRMSRMDYAELAVGAVADRIMPIGWRTATDANRDGDAAAKQISDVNELPLIFGDNLRNMLSMADSYMVVGPPGVGRKVATISVEDPRDTITAEDPATRQPIAGLKLYRDDWDARDVAKVYLPGTPSRVYTLVSTARSSTITRAGIVRMSSPSSSWMFDESEGGESGAPLPKQFDNQIPMVRFTNKGGVGEFEPHLPVLDRINDTIFESVTIAKHQAFRQRAFKGLPLVYPEGHELAGEPIEYDEDAFAADPGSLWNLPPGVDIWESSPVDLGPIRLMIRDDVMGFAAVTRTPLSMITPDAANGSAEGASTMREAHVFRTEDRMRRCHYGLNKVMAYAFAWDGDTARSDPTNVQTIWAPIERYSLQEKMAAAATARAAGLPQASIFTDVMGYTPADLPRLDQERTDDLLLAPIVPATQPAAPTPAAPVPVAPPVTAPPANGA